MCSGHAFTRAHGTRPRWSGAGAEQPLVTWHSTSPELEPRTPRGAGRMVLSSPSREPEPQQSRPCHASSPRLATTHLRCVGGGVMRRGAEYEYHYGTCLFRYRFCLLARPSQGMHQRLSEPCCCSSVRGRERGRVPTGQCGMDPAYDYELLRSATNGHGAKQPAAPAPLQHRPPATSTPLGASFATRPGCVRLSSRLD